MHRIQRDIETERTADGNPPQRERKHPDEYQADLNPNHMAGQNIGSPQAGLPNAHDRKDVHNAMSEIDDDDLQNIPIVPNGERLQQGATYLNLNDQRREEFTATGEMSAGEGERIVPKSEVPYPLWNRLRGIDDSERTP